MCNSAGRLRLLTLCRSDQVFVMLKFRISQGVGISKSERLQLAFSRTEKRRSSEVGNAPVVGGEDDLAKGAVYSWSRKGRIYTSYKNPSLFWGDTAKVQELANLIKAKYLKDFKKFRDSPVCYGTLNDRIGYIILTGMGTEALDQTRTTKKAFDQLIKKFRDRKVLVIDIRFNNVGFDAASLLISGYFTKTPYVAYIKQAYYRGEYTEPLEIYVHPNGLYYDGDIVLLTSKYTVSAGETFAQALLANPSRRIRVVGEETKGFYSDCLPRKIKENWYFGLSNERYLSVDGRVLEGTGIKPDVYIPVQYSEVQNGIDPVIE